MNEELLSVKRTGFSSEGVIYLIEHRAQIFQIFKKVGVKLYHIFLLIKLLERNYG